MVPWQWGQSDLVSICLLQAFSKTKGHLSTLMWQGQKRAFCLADSLPAVLHRLLARQMLPLFIANYNMS